MERSRVDDPVTLVTGTRTGIGRFLAEHYVGRGHRVVGCSRGEVDWALEGYTHYALDVADEQAAKALFADVRKTCGRVDHLIDLAHGGLIFDLRDDLRWAAEFLHEIKILS